MSDRSELKSRVDGRRYLDGGTNSDSILTQIEDELSSLGSSVKSSVEGLTTADVAAGADTSQLSRAQKASLFIDGAVPGFFDSAIQWSPAIDFDTNITALAAASVGAVLVLQANANAFTTALDTAVPPRFAFLWDDSVLDGDGVLKLDLTKPTILVSTIGPPKGQRLTLWSTDPAIAWQVIQSAPASEADAIRKQVFGAVGAGKGGLDGFIDQVKGAIGSVFDVEKEGALLLLAVAGVVLYVLATNTKIDAVAVA